MTNNPPIYTAHDVSDLINSLPTLFGFWPAESLVAIATHGPRRRFGFRLRLDMPGATSADPAGQLVVGHLRNQQADGAIVIAMTADQDAAKAVLDGVHRQLDRHDDIELIVRARADGDRYWTDSAGSDPEGVPYQRSDHHMSVVQAVAAGQEILPDRQALVDRFAPVSGVRREWLINASEAILAEVLPRLNETDPQVIVRTGMAVIEPIFERAMAGEAISDADLLRACVWLSSTPVRDAVCRGLTRESARDLLPVLVKLAQTVVPPYESAVLSLAALAAWLTGDGARALIAVERALDTDRCYLMANQILDLLDAGISPESWETFRAVRAGGPFAA